MKVAIGSTNPKKILPTELVFSHHFDDVQIIPVAVPSGVRQLPLTNNEMYQGATNRARRALEKVPDADFAIGIEGGLHKYQIGWVKKEIIVVIDQKGKIGIGTTGEVQIPQKIMELVGKGKSLGEAIYKSYAIRNSGKNGGIVGIVTKSYIVRSEALRHGISFALAPFLHENIY